MNAKGNSNLSGGRGGAQGGCRGELSEGTTIPGGGARSTESFKIRTVSFANGKVKDRGGRFTEKRIILGL